MYFITLKRILIICGSSREHKKCIKLKNIYMFCVASIKDIHKYIIYNTYMNTKDKIIKIFMTIC